MAYLLFADDEPEVIQMAADHFARKGYKTQVVTDGRMAIEALHAERPDVLITDLMMPFADGFQVIDAACSRYPDRRVPVVLLTGVPPDGQPLRFDPSDRLAPLECIIREQPDREMAERIIQTVEKVLQQRESGVIGEE
jgi:CheY-like chemotaxis protein